jgi:hypothetical protein
MARRIGLYVGLGSVDSDHYRDNFGEPWSGLLRGTENDARAMSELMTTLGVEAFAPALLGESATSSAVLHHLAEMAAETSPGDLVIVTFAGHGGQMEDGDGDEDDGLDETWCLYDRQVIDDELHDAYARFAEGVRIVVISDSCHSGSVTRLAPESGALPRSMSDGASIHTRNANEALYRDVLADRRRGEVRPGPTVELLAACQDDELSWDDEPHGVFTAALLASPAPRDLSSLDEWLATAASLIKPSYNQHPRHSVYTVGAPPAPG